jgi:hypothetical protein
MYSLTIPEQEQLQWWQQQQLEHKLMLNQRQWWRQQLDERLLQQVRQQLQLEHKLMLDQ